MAFRRKWAAAAMVLGLALAWAGCGGGPDAGLLEGGSDSAAGDKAASDPLLKSTVNMKKQLKTAKAAGKSSGVPAGMPGMAPPTPPSP